MITIGNIGVHQSLNLTKAKFTKLFKGKYKGDLDQAFKEYKKRLKAYNKAL